MTDIELMNLKKEIQSSKEKLSELKGERKVLIETLQKKYGCDSVQKAEKKLTDFEKKILALEARKENGMKELEENYEF